MRSIQVEACERCGQPTRNFWLAHPVELSPWCTFCVTLQVAGAVGASRFRRFLETFAGSIDSGAPDGLRAASLSLRAIASMVRDMPIEPGPPPEDTPH